MSLRVLAIADGDTAEYLGRWDNLGIRAVVIPYESVIDVVHRVPSAEMLFDAVVIFCINSLEIDSETWTDHSPAHALRLAESIRSLPEESAMFDGRKWVAIPLILICGGDSYTAAREALVTANNKKLADIRVVRANQDSNLGGDAVVEEIEKYRLRLLDAFDDLGFIVRYRAGRFVVDRALKTRRTLESQYYFGPSDQHRRRYVTIHKDHFGLELEVEAFEALINQEDAKELELQKFFEEHPHFLSATHTPMPHVRLGKKGNKLLVPDFILKPIVAQQRDSRWELLELKLPQERLLAGLVPAHSFQQGYLRRVRSSETTRTTEPSGWARKKKKCSAGLAERRNLGS